MAIDKFDQTKLKKLLKTEYEFINNLFSIASFPTRDDDASDDKDETVRKPKLLKNKTLRAKSLVDLQTRIEKLTNKNNVTYKQKLQKRNLKNRLKKKMKKENRSDLQRQKKGLKSTKTENEDENEATKEKTKPTFNKDSKMVFSKIDFKGLGKEKRKKTEKDPKKLLEKVQEVKTQVEKLKEIGEIDKAVEIKEKTAWKNALAKSQGIKVKDDPILLKKSIQKIEQKKRSSKKKWDKRIEGVKKTKDEKQKKRTENIDKRKKDKKLNKLKKAAKQGRIIPGL